MRCVTDIILLSLLAVGHASVAYGIYQYVDAGNIYNTLCDKKDVVKLADDNLYKAKEAGRNCFKY